SVIVELGARRRWPFRREGPNGSALLLKVRLLSSDRTRAGQRRWGGSHRPHSLQWFPLSVVRHPRGMPLRDMFFPCLYLY
ncbi:hypothetical protein Taro_003215, partial [Colocasia esculenta]|nr:hypothetical protein [Colocasia esculenta]